jgi:hypothetical protein
MFLLAVTVVAVALLFLLTTFALWASGQAWHPLRLAALLAVILSLGLVLLLE